MIRGFSLIEVLIAITVMASSLIAITLVLTSIPQALSHARMHQEALSFVERAFSRELARGPDGFQRIASSTTIEDGITIEVREKYLGDGSLKHIQSHAFWTSATVGVRAVSVSGFLTDYKNAARYACSPFLIGNWEHPQTDEVLPANGRFPALAAIAATRQQVLVAASSTRELGDPSLFLFRTPQGAAPEASGIYDHATSTKVGYLAVALSASNVFALTAHSCTGATACASLDVFLLDDSLMRIASYALPTARSVAYANDRLYVGLRAFPEGPELLIFNVQNPVLPIRIGSLETGATVNDIALGNGYAYIATADNSIIGNQAVIIIDSDEPYEGMRAVASGRPPGAGISQRLSLAGTDLFVGRSSPRNSKELYRFNEGDLAHPLAGTESESSIRGLISRGFQLLALTRETLVRFNTSDPDLLELRTGAYTLTPGQSGVALTCGGRVLFLASSAGTDGTLLMLSGS